jgi:hypothetical protein
MRRLIEYFRQSFCKHDWEKEETIIGSYVSDFGSKENCPKVSLYCKKCGHHKSYWKY